MSQSPFSPETEEALQNIVRIRDLTLSEGDITWDGGNAPPNSLITGSLRSVEITDRDTGVIQVSLYLALEYGSPADNSTRLFFILPGSLPAPTRKIASVESEFSGTGMFIQDGGAKSKSSCELTTSGGNKYLLLEVGAGNTWVQATGFIQYIHDPR